ncbi:MAG: sigma-70 family RNA polymerase sigma factor [Deltaproteobacteria bacterium]|nr:sigma-70 family RNA polymerase sigma factor [Deltaproteobacteria bacterium]
MQEHINIDILFTEHAPFLGRVIERISGRGPHVDDILQETFIVAYKKRHKFDASKSLPRTWLYGIAVKLCLGHERGKRRFNLFYNRFSSEITESPRRPDDLMEQESLTRTVRNAIEKMPMKQREVFVLFELEEMDGRQISELLNIPEGTVWTRLLHGRKHFKKQIARITGTGGIR